MPSRTIEKLYHDSYFELKRPIPARMLRANVFHSRNDSSKAMFIETVWRITSLAELERGQTNSH